MGPAGELCSKSCNNCSACSPPWCSLGCSLRPTSAWRLRPCSMFYLATAFGFGASIVRRTVVEESHLRSILAANLIAAFVLTIGGVLAAPLVARLIGSPHASWAIAAIMPSMIMVAVGSISEALLLRQLRFQAMSLLGIGATVTYVAVELGLAALGFGYWSVVLGFLAMQLLQNVGFVVLAGWRPRLASPGSGVPPRWAVQR